VLLLNKPFPPEGDVRAPDASLLRPQITLEYEWLKKVSDTDGTENVSWAAHHASKKRSPPSEASITSLRDPAYSVATVRHVMDKIKQTVSFLNPGQVPIMTTYIAHLCSGKASPVALAWTIWWRQVHHHVWRPTYRDGCTEVNWISSQGKWMDRGPSGSRVGFFWNSRIFPNSIKHHLDTPNPPDNSMQSLSAPEISLYWLLQTDSKELWRTAELWRLVWEAQTGKPPVSVLAHSAVHGTGEWRSSSWFDRLEKATSACTASLWLS